MISQVLVYYFRDNWCNQFCCYNPRNHICIKQLEAETLICLTCKRLTKLNQNVRRNR